MSTSTAVPPNASEVLLEVSALASAISQANALSPRVTTGQNMLNYKTQTTAPGTIDDHPRLPNVSQNFFYIRATALATDIWVIGFTNPS